jgi:hypothetical protein
MSLRLLENVGAQVLVMRIACWIPGGLVRRQPAHVRVSTEDRAARCPHFRTNATELVHIGQAVMGCGATVDYPVDAILNYPTFPEAYQSRRPWT